MRLTGLLAGVVSGLELGVGANAVESSDTSRSTLFRVENQKRKELDHTTFFSQLFDEGWQ